MPTRVDLGTRSYNVYYRSLEALPDLMHSADLRRGRCLFVTDENVASHYRSSLIQSLESEGWSVKALALPPGERTKSADALHSIYDAALTWGVDRQTPVLAVGGGVIGDLAGFAAATLLRGLPLVQVPTSLLAQVDASIGGKTGINHETGKNLIGSFYQPALVCADPTVLDTLPEREYTSGMAEVVKHALIKDPSLVRHLEEHLESILTRQNPEAVATTIRRAVAVKAEVVSEDEREKGRRAILNFGHTFGHAVEAVAGYGTFSHGEAVAIGMRAGLYLSHQRHPTTVPRDRIDDLVRAIPVDEDPSRIDFGDLYTAMQADKKNEGETIRFVLLDEIGHAYVTGNVTRAEAHAAWTFACEA